MIAVWLYGSDGRALYCVYVQSPMPLTVTFAGSAFAWNSAARRYEQMAVAYAVPGDAPFAATKEVPAADRPPKEN